VKDVFLLKNRPLTGKLGLPVRDLRASRQDLSRNEEPWPLGAAARVHGRMARGGHGLPKVSLEPAMPYPSAPVGGPPLKLPYGCFKGDLSIGQLACGSLLPL
jgi:hypothetical protein